MVMLNKIVSSEKDLVAIVFFGTVSIVRSSQLHYRKVDQILCTTYSLHGCTRFEIDNYDHHQYHYNIIIGTFHHFRIFIPEKVQESIAFCDTERSRV